MAALNVMQIAPFHIMDTGYSDMLDPGFLTVTILRQEMAVSLLVLLLCQPDLYLHAITIQWIMTCQNI